MKTLLTLLTIGLFASTSIFASDLERTAVSLQATQATIDGYDYETGDTLAMGETIAVELANSQVILASATTTQVQGYIATSFRSSLDCVGQTFSDASFIVLPDQSPYDKDGNPIDTKKVVITDKSPVALIVWHKYQQAKKAGKV